MIRFILTLALAAISIVHAHAQGSIFWRNSAATPILLSFGGLDVRTATAADGLTFGLYYGPLGSSLDSLVLAPGTTATIGNTPGVLDAPQMVTLAGTDAGQTVLVQARAWIGDGQFLQGPPVRQILLGPTAGPATAPGVWTTDPSSRTFSVPEPSVLALAALGGAFAFFKQRNRTRK